MHLMEEMENDELKRVSAVVWRTGNLKIGRA